jgi:hypothetical protein
MFNSGLLGDRAPDGFGIVSNESQFIQASDPQPSISGWTISGTDDIALDPLGGQTVIVNGGGFVAGLTVTVDGTIVSPVTLLGPTQISFTSIPRAGGLYTLAVYNTNGTTAILVPGLYYSSIPTFSTASGNIGTNYETQAISTSVVASSDTAVTYSLVSGSLPAGATLYANGVISGTSPTVGSSTTYSFTIKAEDAEKQDVVRSFTLTVNPDIVSWSAPSADSVISTYESVAIANTTLTATNLVSGNITYTGANLPSGISITGNTLSGTTTTVGNSAITLTATSASSTKTANRTAYINVQQDSVTWSSPANASVITTYEYAPIANTSLSATSAAGFGVEYSQSGAPTGVSISGNTLAGTSTVVGNANVTLTATANTTNRTQTRTVYVNVQQDAVTFSNPANATTDYTLIQNEAMDNITLAATSAAGFNVSYSANTLPTGISLTGNTISGTPTVVANSSSLVTGTSATSNRTTTRTFNWTIILPLDQFFSTNAALIATPSDSLTWISDASTNKFELSIAGDVRPSAKTPYSDNTVLYLPGGSSYITLPANTPNLQFGTGDWTIEFWAMPETDPSGDGIEANTWLLSIGSQLRIGLGGNAYWLLGMGSGGGINPVVSTLGGAQIGLYKNQWTHLALTRKGNNFTFWVNGIYGWNYNNAAVGTNFTGTIAIADNSLGNGQGTRFNGWIAGLRILKGTALFDPSIAWPARYAISSMASPFANITNTVFNLRVRADGTLSDISGNNYSVTKLGTPRATSNFGPWLDTNVISGSGYFDGTGDYLTAPANAAFDFGTGDFTIELYFYRSGIKGNSFHDNIIGNRPTSLSSGQWHLFVGPTAGGAFSLTARTPAGDITLSGGVCIENAWNHLAVVRNGTSLSLFVNGINVNSTTTSTSIGDSVSNLSIAAFNDGAFPTIGYVSNVRIVKGTAVYTANFTVPTSPLTAIANTSLLTLQNRTDEGTRRFIECSSNNWPLTRTGGVSQGSFSPYGQTGFSYYFNNTASSRIIMPTSDDLKIGSSDFTIEFWGYLEGTSGGIYGSDQDSLQIFYASDTLHLNKLMSAAVVNFSLTGYKNKWTHYAFSKSGGTTRMFFNGVQVASAADTQNYAGLGSTTRIGGIADGTGNPLYMRGWLCDFHVLRGTGKYTANFTPPTGLITPNSSGTVLLTARSNRIVDDGPNRTSFTSTIGVSTQPFSPFSPQLVRPTGYSVYFNGSTDFLDNSFAGSAVSFSSNPFTIEFWMYPTVVNSTTRAILENRAAASEPVPVISLNTSNQLIYFVSGSTRITSSITISANTWYHVALVRNSGTTTMYIDGTSRGTWTDSTSYSSTSVVRIGQAYTTPNNNYVGYICDLRITNNVAVYTGAFARPIGPLALTGAASASAYSSTTNVNTTFDTNRVLLHVCQDSWFSDKGARSFLTRTPNGSTAISTWNPFQPATTTTSSVSYSGLTVGGSAYFDGTGYLEMTDNSSLQFGTENFFIEFWAYATTSLTTNYIISQWGSANRGCIVGVGVVTSGQMGAAFSTTGSDSITVNDTAAFPINQWVHVVVARTTTTLALYVNGLRKGTGTFGAGATVFNSTNNIRIGAHSDGAASNYWTGYISELRTGRSPNNLYPYMAGYTSIGIPYTAMNPTSTITTNSNTFAFPMPQTTLALSFDNAGIVNATNKSNFVTNGSVKTTNVNTKFGNNALRFTSATSDYINPVAGTYPIPAQYQLGTGDFTIEFWINFVTVGSFQYIVDFRPESLEGAYPTIYMNSSSKLIYFANSSDRITGTTTMVTNTWYHVAVVRSSGSTKLYVNGANEGSTYTDATDYLGTASRPRLGSNSNFTGNYLNAYIDDFRISRIARYTTNFSVPTRAYFTL